MKTNRNGVQHMNKKTFFIAINIFQLLLILFTIFNILFCYITSQQTIFLGSISFLFIPYFRFINYCNITDFFILLLFIAITLLLSIKSLVETINKKKKVNFPFLSLNILWVWFASFSCIFTEELNYYENAFSPFTLLINFILLLSLFIYKTFEYRASICKLDQNVVTYKKIEKTSKQILAIEGASFVFCFIFWYFSKCSSIGKNIFIFISDWLYIFVTLIAIIYFIATIDAFYRHKKSHLEPLPSPNYIKQINIKQIVSFLFFELSYILINFMRT